MRLSCLKPVHEVILEKVTTMFPLVEHACCIEQIKDDCEIHFLNDDKIDILLKKENWDRIIFETETYNWFELSEVFSMPLQPRLGKNLFDELERNVFISRFCYKQNSIILIIHFEKNKAQLGLLGSDLVLTQDNKLILANLVYSSIQSDLKKMETDESIFLHFRQSVNLVNVEIQQNNTKHRQSVAMLEKMLVEFAKDYMESQSAKMSIPISITATAIEKIMSFRGHPTALKQMIDHAIILALNMNPKDPVLIDDWNWQYYNEKEEKNDKRVDNESTQISAVYQRTWEWLNRMEEAVERVVQNHLAPTGTNVALAMKPSITAAAISDAMKKQDRFLKTLLLEYPEKWPGIRKYFKPIKSRIENYNEEVRTA